MGNILQDEAYFYLNEYKDIVKTEDGYKLQPGFERLQNGDIVRTECSKAMSNQNSTDKICFSCTHSTELDSSQICEIRSKLNGNPKRLCLSSYVHNCDACEYIEPLTVPVLEKIIEKEKPDSILPTLGGQAGLNLAMEIAETGFLEEHNVKLIGTTALTIKKAEDRLMFKETMEKIGEPCAPSLVVNNVEDGEAFAAKIGYPVVLRPAYTLGGSGGGIAKNVQELREILENGLRLSRVGEVLVERCIAGWKEIEYEVMRDSNGTCITICNMENIDPVGVHTGDSIVVAPSQTLSDKEYQMLRTSALRIIDELGITGGCNVQYALHPDSFEYCVIEVNPRVSRSSALASKATGYPIAKVAAKIALGYTLDEIKNAVTGKTYASFEPALDYCVVKIPRLPFDKFISAKRTLTTQMKATGEVMSISDNFEGGLMKAIRSLEQHVDSLMSYDFTGLTDEELLEELAIVDDRRIWKIAEGLRRHISAAKMHDITKIDLWFIDKLQIIVDMENALKRGPLTESLLREAKRIEFPDNVIGDLTGHTEREIKELRDQYNIHAAFKMVDTCAAEFAATTPYYYSVYGSENEAVETKDKKKVLVLGSGPIRIGQGIEFDFCSVHCTWAFKKEGFETIIINNNPETVSTDFDIADKLYFEPLTAEDVESIVDFEKPDGAVVQFGGQTAIKLTEALMKMGVPILGTKAEDVDAAEDRELFDEILEQTQIPRAKGQTVFTVDEALKAANELGYPVLVRPSYVLGGQGMQIAVSDEDVVEFMNIINRIKQDHPILVDKYLMGKEIEVDAVCDGQDILIPGIMEHIERTGIHSGDSIAVYPAWNVSDSLINRIIECSKKLAIALNTKGLVNIQYIAYHDEIYVIEVNPRSSRTIPYISKVTGVPMVDLATKCMLGEKLKDMGYGTGLYRNSPYVAVKVPVFSFEKLIGVDNHLGPEMKSTGEVLAVSNSLEESLYKGLTAAGYKLGKKGGVFITVRDSDKGEIPQTAKMFADLGFKIYATNGTAKVLHEHGIDAEVVAKIHENEDNNTLTLIESGKIAYVISTSSKGRIPTRDSVKIRRKTVEWNIPCLTSIDTANAIAASIRSKYTESTTEIVDINNMRTEKQTFEFTKMQGCGNDYIYFNCFDQRIDNPEGLALNLSDRHFGIGGDGVILICRSKVADAKMRMFNLDGSEGKMCGNGIRCVAKFMRDNGIVDKDEMTIETLSGIMTVSLIRHYGEVSGATVNMGKAILAPHLVPVELEPDENGRVVDRKVNIAGNDYNITCVSMGNPHAVVFMNNVDSLDIDKVGPEFEHDKIFPERVNAEFIKVIDDHTLKMRVWERGSGETWACGTGACAAAVAAVLNGFCKKDEEISVILKGGTLKIRYTDEAVYLTGDAVTVFSGHIVM